MLRPARLAALLALVAAPAALAQTPLHTLESPSPRNPGQFGLAVAALSDVDGDGAGDLVVGAVWEANLAGRVHLFSGATGTLIRTVQSPTPGDGQFGNWVAPISDLDGDGTDDLLVGAFREGSAATGYGRVHVFSGATGALIRTLAPPLPQDRGLRTPEFGVRVAAVPDVNGDGTDDILVGAINEGTDEQGRAHLFSGATGDLLFSIDSPNEESQGGFGYAVSGVSDTDGDGTPDLLVGAPLEAGGASRAGRAYLFSGATGALLQTLTSPNASATGLFGRPVLGVADADGDGRGDLLVGAGREASQAGRVYLFSGATGTLLRTFASPNEEASGWFGDALAEVPDVDGDGMDDLLLGAPEEDAGGVLNAGRGYLFSGATGTLLATLVSPNPEGVNPGGIGSSVAGVPDVNGDGRGDLLLGVPKEDGGMTNAGRAYLFSGSVAVASEPEPDRSGLALIVAPNPASESATLTVSLAMPLRHVRVAVFDVLGREVAALHDGPLAAGAHAFPLARLGPGVYVARARSAGGAATTRLTLSR